MKARIRVSAAEKVSGGWKRVLGVKRQYFYAPIHLQLTQNSSNSVSLNLTYLYFYLLALEPTTNWLLKFQPVSIELKCSCFIWSLLYCLTLRMSHNNKDYQSSSFCDIQFVFLYLYPVILFYWSTEGWVGLCVHCICMHTYILYMWFILIYYMCSVATCIWSM